MNERLKKIRKEFRLNQEEFGKRLGVTKTAVSKMELGTYNITDSMTKLVCREFNIDYIWFTTGIGDMIADSDLDIMEKIDIIMAGENEMHKNIIKTVASFDIDDILAIEKMFDKYIE